MIDSSLVARRRDTFFRQAKRLADTLDLPLTSAKSILARALYRCSSEADLLGRFEGRALDEHLELLTGLPHSSRARSYFVANRRELAHSLSQHVLTNSNLARLFEVLREVFAISDGGPTTLSDLLPSLLTTAWSPCGPGPDPESVLHANAVIGGVGIRLVATRVYMPNCYDFGPDVQPEYAVPYGSLLKIVWADPDAWRQAALDYIEDEDAEDFLVPDVRLTEEMSRHQQWFEAALENAGSWCRYGDGEETPIPHIIEGRGCYLVFGFPYRLAEPLEPANSDDLLPDADEDSTYRTVLIDGAPVCLEWIAFDPETDSPPGECGKYFEAMRHGLLLSEQLPPSKLSDGTLGILSVQPATDFHLGQALKVEFQSGPNEVAFVLKTDDAALASALVAQVARRDLMVWGAEQHPQYLARMIMPANTEPSSLSLSMNVVGSNFWSGTSLISQTVASKQGDCGELLVVISPELLMLVDLVGKKAVERAITQGLVFRKPLIFQDELERAPSRCQNLLPPSPELAERLALPPEGVPRWAMARYKRDNF